MSRHPSLSVVMPVGRVDVELANQLDALVAQNYAEPWELVLSLNTDDAAERSALDVLLEARPFLDATIVDSSAHRSAAHARNVGAAAASGLVLCFCDGDDVADPGWISGLVAAVAPGRAVGGHLEEGLLAIPGQENWRPPATPGALPSFLGHPYLVSANMGVHRQVFEQVGGFDTTLIRGEDVAFSWDLLDAGIELTYAAEAVMHYRHRRGLVPMMRQHFLYGRGFSQLLARRGMPGGGSSASGLRALRPNGQPVDHKGVVYLLRRGSIAAGRVAGLVEQRARRRGPAD
ncbi:MAG: glycosyltransferase [Acidimicrobiales bacterium]